MIKPSLFIALAIFITNSFAQGKDVICTFKGAPKYVSSPSLKKHCMNFDSPTETCTKFEVRGKQKSVWVYQSQIGRFPKDGQFLAFKPYNITYAEEYVGGDGYSRWVLYFIDNSGSPSRAEERFMVLEDGTGKALTKLMSYQEFDAYKKEKRAEDPSQWIEKTMTMSCQ